MIEIGEFFGGQEERGHEEYLVYQPKSFTRSRRCRRYSITRLFAQALAESP